MAKRLDKKELRRRLRKLDLSPTGLVLLLGGNDDRNRKTDEAR